MKLTKLESFVVKVPPPYRGGSYFFFVKLHTDESVYGWGETATLGIYYPLQQSYKVLLKEIFETYLKGENPMDRERLNKILYTRITARHTEYSTLGLVSAIDTALWDIAGKVCNQPVYNLLGGAFRKKLRSYTYIYDVKGGARTRSLWDDPQRVAEAHPGLPAPRLVGARPARGPGPHPPPRIDHQRIDHPRRQRAVL